MTKDTPPTMEIFEMFQKMVNPMAFPMQNLLMGSLSLEELEKKISELRTVQHWLNTNVGMLDLTIKTLEYQRVLLTPSDPDKPSAGTGIGPDHPLFNPALWPWGFAKPDPGAAAAKAGAETPPQAKPGARKRG